MVIPNSYGDDHHLQEKWSDEARAAAAASRRRGTSRGPAKGAWKAPKAGFWDQHAKSAQKLADRAEKAGEFHRAVSLSGVAVKARANAAGGTVFRRKRA